MWITLEKAGKRFNRDWIFRSLDYRFSSGKAYAITGNNGSGKSTLLQVIAGAGELSEGSMRWEKDGSKAPQQANSDINTHQVPPERIHHQLSLVAPYLELIEEMTAREFLNFHKNFKPLIPGYTTAQVLEAVQLKTAMDKQIRYYSSGMKQRIKLAQGLFTDVPVVLLDEPCTNLDSVGFELYQRLIRELTRDRLVIVSSNDRQEYSFCTETIDIRDYKQRPQTASVRR